MNKKTTNNKQGDASIITLQFLKIVRDGLDISFKEFQALCNVNERTIRRVFKKNFKSNFTDLKKEYIRKDSSEVCKHLVT